MKTLKESREVRGESRDSRVLEVMRFQEDIELMHAQCCS